MTAVVILAAGCGLGLFQAVAGSGTVKRELREVPDFTAVEVNSVVHATVRTSPKAPVVLEGDENLLPLITTEVRDDRLVVAVKNGVNIKPTRPIKVDITTPVLARVAATGASEVDAVAAPAERFAIVASGATTVTVRQINSGAVTVEISGASRMTLVGKAKSVTLGVSGASHVKAESLTAESAVLDVSGASHVEIGATATIKGDISGASHLDVLGSPDVRNVGSSGASHVLPTEVLRRREAGSPHRHSCKARCESPESGREVCRVVKREHGFPPRLSAGASAAGR
jgi:hypothetical protein